MLNIEVQTCGLVLDLVLLYFLYRHEHAGLVSERLFRTSLAVNLALIILDINSIFFIVNDDILPQLAVELACKVYLVSLVVAAYMGFVYAYTDVKQLRECKPFRIAVLALLVVGAGLIFITDVQYTHSGREVYSFGPSAQWTYVFAPFFILCALSLTFFYRRQMNVHRRRAVRAWMMLTIIAAGIQLVVPKLLLVGFASSLGMLVLYAELENPEANLDRATGVFSFHCLTDYIQQLFDQKKRFACMGICLGQDWKVDRDTQQQILLDVSTYLHGFTGAKLFRGLGNDFIMVYEPDGENDDYAIACKDDIGFIRQKFENPFEDTMIPAAFMYLPDNRIITNAEELLQIYQDYRLVLVEEKRDQITLDDEALAKVREFGNIKHEILAALDEDRIEVFLQPIYSVKEQRFVSAEALARLRYKDGNLMMPGIFIPVAEETGLIEHIGERVFRKTCQYMKEDNLKNMGIQYIEVNLSAVQCENEELADKFRDIMHHHGLKPNAINLEITESSALNNRDILLNNMDKLRDTGVSFSLDDFGTGESNLNYIVDMPVDIVKFDHSMTQDYFRNDRARIVMDATVRMIKELGLRIVAEGVETKEQLDTMTSIGIDYIQGFYFSRPLPYPEFVKFIEEKNLDKRAF